MVVFFFKRTFPLLFSCVVMETRFGLVDLNLPGLLVKNYTSTYIPQSWRRTTSTSSLFKIYFYLYFNCTLEFSCVENELQKFIKHNS